MAKTKPAHRVVLQLDPRIALEAIILNRLERIPTTRRQEWLRGLLVQGFRTECQALRGVPDDAKGHPTIAFKTRMTGEAPKTISLRVPEPAVVKGKSSQVHAASKPFATLGKVIG